MNNLNRTALESYVDKYGITRYGNIGPKPNTPAPLLYGPDGNLTPESQAQFESEFNPSDYKPMVPGATPGIAPPGILTAEENTQIDEQYAAEQAAAQPPILSQQPPILSQQPPPDEEKEPWQMSFAEKMGRYGGNGLAAQGGRAAVGAMGSTTAEIFEAERVQNQQIEENEVARLTKQGTSSAALKKQNEIQNMHDTRIKYDQAIQDFIRYGDTVTGPLDITVQSLKDSQGFGDAEREAFRYRIREIIISDTLLQTAKTSGAISDRETVSYTHLTLPTKRIV